MKSKEEFKGLGSIYFVVGLSAKFAGKTCAGRSLPSRRDKLYASKCTVSQCGIFTVRNMGSQGLVKQAM